MNAGKHIWLLYFPAQNSMKQRDAWSSLIPALLWNMPLERSKKIRRDWNKIGHIDVNLLHENTGDVLVTAGKLSVLMLVSYPQNTE